MATTVYDVSGHALLSAKAAGLSDDALVEQTAWAAELLGVSETTYTGDKLTKVKRALVLQINYQILLDPEVFYKKSNFSAASKQSTVYRDGISLVFPMAAGLIAEVDGAEGWRDCKSVRRSFL
jgi:hypothetical protein